MAGKRFFISVGLMFLFLVALMPQPALLAQDGDNLLQNGSFDGPGSYRPSGRGDFTFAQGWSGWYTNSPSTESWMNLDPIAYPHTAAFRYDGNASQNVGRGDATFTAAAFQVVNGIAEGTTLRASAWVFQDNSEGNGSRTRIGIGSNVGGNPLASAIEWSPWMTAIDSWQQVRVEATVPAGSVTVFIYSTQDKPAAGNQNYYDQAELVIVGQGAEVNVGNTATPAVPPTNTPPPFAPFVNPQSADEDGRIEHTVQSGDTLAAIAVAYGVPVSQIRELNNLDGAFLQVGQVLLIQEATEAAPTDEQETETTGAADEAAPETTEEGAASSGFASPTPTSTPQEVAQESTATATLDVTATPSPIPSTPTDAPTAPVETGDNSDPLAVESAVCVLMFDDTNQNTVQEPGEGLLAGGTITLTDSAGSEETYVTDGEAEPHCFADLPSGSYTIAAQAPAGYGVINSSSLVVNMQAGQQFTLRFAAAEGVAVAQAPTPDSSVTDAEPGIVEVAAPDEGNSLRNIAGVIVLALAGVVLLGGIGVAFLVSRR
ncbi:MAG: LysM peptidoglycan-binding domain-containing protein [Anaerolineae bacterium]|nr:LysM peptidoglycan-binding domain-containing protein [Anaerolineae bacterium]